MDSELVRHVAATTGLSGEVAARVVADVVAVYGETTAEFVRRRHRELQARERRNAEIWTVIAGELAQRPVAPGAVNERRLRRIVYG
jgi:phage protein D